MSVVKVIRKPRRSGGINNRRLRTYSVDYEVETNDKDDGPAVVTQYLLANVADIGNAYGGAGSELTDLGTYLQSWTVDCTTRDGLTWKATAEYGPLEPPNEDPLLESPDYDWDGVTFEEVVDQDVDGLAVVNSAGDYFDPPITRDANRSVLTVTRNESSFNPGLADLYRDVVNSDTFAGAAPGTVKCSSIKGKWVPFPDLFAGGYWQVTYVFHFKREGWNRVILDQGFRKLDGTTRKPILIDGEPASSPVLLNGLGDELTPGNPPEFLEFEVYESAAFSVFNL